MKFNCAYTELVDIHKLVPNPKNNNHHPKEQIDRLAKIIDYQGQRSPIVVSNRSGFIVKGHGRLEAIRKLGWEKVAVDYQDYDNEAQEYADMTADNQIAMWAEFDNEMLKEEIPKLGGFDLDLLGMKDMFAQEQDETLQEPEQIDIGKQQVKIAFAYKDSHEIIDKFICEIQEKYPSLIFQVEIND